jgi:glycosyltransferase involved in cell wall biosynthesis
MKPIVSVLMITYNHEKYIAQAIDSVLMQKSNFDYEIVIGEDSSTDKTREIVLNYKTRYPNKIKLLLHETNVGMLKNFVDTINNCTGTYVALLEGDDYWIDPYKLQKQVDFLDTNPDYSLVHTAVKVFNQKKRKLLKIELGDTNNTFQDFLIKNRIITLTVLFRTSMYKKYFEDFYPQILTWNVGDYPMWLWFALESKIMFLPECTGVYRIVEGTASRPKNIEKKITYTNSIFEIKKFFAQQYGCPKDLWNSILLTNAEIKIKKGVLIGSYDFYKEGIDDKISLGIKISAMEIIYGILLSNSFFRWILLNSLSFRKYSS